MKGKPKITIKNLKYAAFASQETSCFEGTVYVDGKRFCIASNEGHGGPDSYDALPPKGGTWSSGEESGAARRELDENVHNVALRHNPNAVRKYPEGGFPTSSEPWEEDDAKRHAAFDREMSESAEVTTWQVFEYLVGDALSSALYLRDLKSALSKKWLFTVPGEDGLFQFKRQKGDTTDNVLPLLIERHGDGAVLVNALPHDEALALWKAN